LVSFISTSFVCPFLASNVIKVLQWGRDETVTDAKNERFAADYLGMIILKIFRFLKKRTSAKIFQSFTGSLYMIKAPIIKA